MKKIYHLYFKEGCDTGYYDSFDSHLAIAETEEEARGYCPCGDECRSYSYKRDGHPCVWRDPDKTICEHIGNAKKDQNAGLVISSFHAG